MKNLIILILILNITHLKSQNINHVLEPILPKNQTNEDLRLKENVIDEIRYKGELIYLEIKNKNSTLEYFKVEDSLYLFRQVLSGELLNRGYYRISEPIEKIDSVFTFDPETYEEKIFVISYYKMEKDGEWKETHNDSTYLMGNYNKGKKTGRWYKSVENIDFYKYWEYQDGELKVLHNPTPVDSEKYVHWILNRPFTLCMISYNYDEDNTEIENWWLETQIDNDCQPFGKFVFKEEGKFEYTHNSDYQMSINKYNGKGKWDVSEEGDIILKFENKEKLVFLIEVLSRDKIRLKKGER